MKKHILALVIILGLGGASFKSADDTLCNINYTGMDSDGCLMRVVGTFDCNSPDPITTFVGTVTLSGDGDCINMELIASRANQDPTTGQWGIPNNVDIAFYTNTDDFCESTTMTWISRPMSQYGPAVNKINKISNSLLSEFKSDIGC